MPRFDHTETSTPLPGQLAFDEVLPTDADEPIDLARTLQGGSHRSVPRTRPPLKSPVRVGADVGPAPVLAPPVHLNGTTYQQRMVRCGRDNCRKCAGGKYGHGPYWYAFWQKRRENKADKARTGAKYVGRTLPTSLLEAVKTDAAVRGST